MSPGKSTFNLKYDTTFRGRLCYLCEGAGGCEQSARRSEESRTSKEIRLGAVTSVSAVFPLVLLGENWQISTLPIFRFTYHHFTLILFLPSDIIIADGIKTRAAKVIGEV